MWLQTLQLIEIYFDNLNDWENEKKFENQALDVEVFYVFKNPSSTKNNTNSEKRIMHMRERFNFETAVICCYALIRISMKSMAFSTQFNWFIR